MFGVAKVYETHWHGEYVRVLSLGGAYQSATYVDDRWCYPPFPYLQNYDCIFRARRNVRNVCMLGGGGFAWPKHLVAHYPDARVDVVEIDPAITAIAQEFFFLDRLEHVYHAMERDRLAIVTQDAQAYLQDCVRNEVRYDAILNDCFAARKADESLLSSGALATAHACLVPKGMYLVNTISAMQGEQAEPLIRLVGALSNEFGHIAALPCNRAGTDEPDNVVVVASEDAIAIPEAVALYDEV